MSADTLRPATLDGYIGQPKLKARITVHVEAAVAQRRPLEHILLTGPPGSGKTTFASIVAHMLNDEFIALSMPVNDRVFERTVRSHNGVVLLDEIHRLSPRQQEGVMALLEFGYFATATGRNIENDWLTVIGATTEPQMLIPPLRQKFPIIPELEPYTNDDLRQVVEGMAQMAGVTLSYETMVALGAAAAGTPRLARRLVLAARDLQVTLDREPTVAEIFDLTGASADGLTEGHIKYLHALDMLGGTAGIELIATVLQLHTAVCKDLERLLVSMQMVAYGPRGRELLSAGGRRISDPRKERTE